MIREGAKPILQNSTTSMKANQLIIINKLTKKASLLLDCNNLLHQESNVFMITKVSARNITDRQNNIYYIDLNYEDIRLLDLILLKLVNHFNWLNSFVIMLYSSRVWRYLFWTIKSLDPDVIYVIDTLWPNLFGKKIRQSLPNIPVASGINPCLVNKVNKSLSYDSNIMVSIVLPVYNGERYLSESIESCLSQTHKNIELIVVNDGSRDRSSQIIKNYAIKDSRILVLEHNVNRGLAAALNTGLNKAKGQFFTWTSHDNKYEVDAIEILARYLCKWREIDFVYSAYYALDEIGQVANEPTYLPPPWKLNKGNVVGPFFMFRREVWERVGEYRLDREYVEDYDYWVRIYKAGFEMMRLDVPAYYYRRHGSSMTSRAAQRERELRQMVINDYFEEKKMSARYIKEIKTL